MKFTVKQPVMTPENKIGLMEIPVENIRIENYSILAIDGSTSNSGLAILREYDGALLYIISAKRESNETPVQYKVRLKKTVKDILINNKRLYQIFYEEPVVANITSVKNLFMLRTFIEEMIVENEPDFDYIKHCEVPNTRWKKLFLSPDKVPQGTDKQKEAVRKKMLGYLPFLDVVSQDEIDAACMGWTATQILKNNGDAIEELKSKKKPSRFQYNIEFIGADYDDGMLSELWDIYSGPKRLLENGINFTEILGKTDFDKHVYSKMGEEDKVLVIKFPSKTHGDLILKHRIGNLAAQFEFIYAIVWRKSRKFNND